MRSTEEFEVVQGLIAAGLNDCMIALQTGIPRRTVCDWRRKTPRSNEESEYFANRSDDIRGLFCAALDDLGIPWTCPSRYQVAAYRKAAVARLDEFVGPKA